MPSRLPGNAPETAIRTMDTCVPVQLVSLHFVVENSQMANAQIGKNKMSIFRTLAVDIFLKHRIVRLVDNSSL